jgi:hypothetical protein
MSQNDKDTGVICLCESMTKLNIEPGYQGAFQVYCGYFHQHEEQPSHDDFEECYRGEFKSVGKFCKNLYTDCDNSYNNLNDTLKKCIDWGNVWDYTVQYDYIF